MLFEWSLIKKFHIQVHLVVIKAFDASQENTKLLEKQVKLYLIKVFVIFERFHYVVLEGYLVKLIYVRLRLLIDPNICRWSYQLNSRVLMCLISFVIQSVWDWTLIILLLIVPVHCLFSHVLMKIVLHYFFSSIFLFLPILIALMLILIVVNSILNQALLMKSGYSPHRMRSLLDEVLLKLQILTHSPWIITTNNTVILMSRLLLGNDCLHVDWLFLFWFKLDKTLRNNCVEKRLHESFVRFTPHCVFVNQGINNGFYVNLFKLVLHHVYYLFAYKEYLFVKIVGNTFDYVD